MVIEGRKVVEVISMCQTYVNKVTLPFSLLLDLILK